MPLDAKLEAILFFKGEPVTKKKLAELANADISDVEEALKTLEERLFGRGLALVFESDTVLLGTAPGVSELIEKVTKEELTRDLGKAGLETLSIILYKKSVSKREIDHIRGVNSAFILRNLLIRGLIERTEGEGRGFYYKPTTDLLAFLGLSRIEDLPEYNTVLNEIENFSTNSQTSEQGASPQQPE